MLAANDRNMLFIQRTKEGRNLQSGAHAFTIDQTSVIFLIILLLLGIAFVVFVLEVVGHKYYMIKNCNKKIIEKAQKKPVIIYCKSVND